MRKRIKNPRSAPIIKEVTPIIQEVAPIKKEKTKTKKSKDLEAFDEPLREILP